jgi:uncharacterized protein (TIGR00369 family)
MPEPSPKVAIDTLAAAFATSPAIAHLGVQGIGSDADGAVRATLPLKPDHERAPGSNQFHGGPIAAFIDTLGDLAVGVMVGGGVPTMNLRIDYLKPAFGPRLSGIARIRRLGRSVAVADIDVTDSSGSLVAIGRAAYQPLVG